MDLLLTGDIQGSQQLTVRGKQRAGGATHKSVALDKVLLTDNRNTLAFAECRGYGIGPLVLLQPVDPGIQGNIGKLL